MTRYDSVWLTLTVGCTRVSSPLVCWTLQDSWSLASRSRMLYLVAVCSPSPLPHSQSSTCRLVSTVPSTCRSCVGICTGTEDQRNCVQLGYHIKAIMKTILTTLKELYFDHMKRVVTKAKKLPCLHSDHLLIAVAWTDMHVWVNYSTDCLLAPLGNSTHKHTNNNYQSWETKFIKGFGYGWGVAQRQTDRPAHTGLMNLFYIIYMYGSMKGL